MFRRRIRGLAPARLAIIQPTPHERARLYSRPRQRHADDAQRVDRGEFFRDDDRERANDARYDAGVERRRVFADGGREPMVDIRAFFEVVSKRQGVEHDIQ